MLGMITRQYSGTGKGFLTYFRPRSIIESDYGQKCLIEGMCLPITLLQQ